MATNPPADLPLTPVGGSPRTLREWVTNFHLVSVVLDPYTNESSWILPTAVRLLRVFREADCRVSFLVIGPPEDARAFLGPYAEEFLTFADDDRSVVKALGLQRLPAFVHLAVDTTVVGAAEGWEPAEWRAVADELATMMSWTRPMVPDLGDPAPFPGAPVTA